MTTIHLAGPQDVPPLRAAVLAAFAPYVERMDRPPAPMLADYESLVGAGEVWVVDRGAGDVAGLVTLRTEDGVAFLGTIAVTPDLAGTGLGTRLLAWAEDHARAAGCSEVRLHTNVAMTENLAWYPRRGYREIGRGTVDGYERVQFVKQL